MVRRTSAVAAPTPDRSRPLSKDEIVAAALRLTKEVGLERLTMRLLAGQLGVTPMAAYYHVPDKRSMLELVGDAVMAQVEVPPPEAGPWDERLRLLNLSVRKVLAEYPGVGSFLLGAPLTTNGRRLVDATVEILLDAGFDEREATLAY